MGGARTRRPRTRRPDPGTFRAEEMLLGDRAGQLAAASQSSSEKRAAFRARSCPPARPPAPGAAARALGPQKGRRARRRQRRTYRARLARAARSLPGRCHRVHPSRAQIQHLAKFKGAGRSGEGAPRRERSRGDRGRVRGGGENSKCYNFLPCPPPGLGGRGTREGRAARAERQ